jgi:hypothetical protein
MALAGASASAKARSAAAAEAYSDLIPVANAMHATGLSLRQIAAQLDADGHTTRSGRPWNPIQVSRLLYDRWGLGLDSWGGLWRSPLLRENVGHADRTARILDLLS